MMKSIRAVTVIGANGTMGRNIAAIFASFGEAEVYLVSRTIEKSIEAKNKAYLSVRAESIKDKMFPTDYVQLEKCIGKSDLIFEACSEDLKIKQCIHKRIADILDKFPEECIFEKVFCSGTSGLSITKLAELYPNKYRHLFMGMHFFNPPYQMTLCELTPTIYTKKEPDTFKKIKYYAERVLLRTVVETPDTPAFLGNRIGFQFINGALQLAEQYKYSGGIDYIDAILGPFTGRSMPPLVTANFVGLDIHKAIIDNLYINTNDYAHESFKSPEFLQELIESGKIGRKAGAGLYKNIVYDSGIRIYQVYDIEHGCYREKMNYTFPFVEGMIRALRVGDYKNAFSILVNNQSLEAKLCCEFMLKYIIYSLNTVKELGCNVNVADDVMAAGFHWCPPLALLVAFEEIEPIEKLCEERLDKSILKSISLNRLLQNVDGSKYDYRKFVFAKR